ncbi:hypothetical protein D1007_33724 [Hordeum vulgare]|nr:hypothetical protein D1007_33724 [Hordeum vulgare]
MCSKMFQGIEQQALRALGSTCKEDVSIPLVPNDAGYLDFFTKVMERLKAGIKKECIVVKEECHGLLSHTLTRVFSYLLHADPCFDSEAMIAPVLELICGALEEEVEDHMGALIAQFIPDGRKGQGGAKEREDNDGSGSYMSP